MPIKSAVKEAVAEAPPQENPRAIIGGNNPPPEEQVILDFREAMIEKLPTWEQRIEDLEAACARAVVDTPEAAGKAGDVVKAIRALSNAIGDAHKDTKEPFLAATRAVDQEKRRHVTRLDDAKRLIEGKQTEFLRKEEARREKERREAEVAARAEAEAAAEAARQRAEAEGKGDIEAMQEVEAVAAPAKLRSEPEPIRSVDTGAAVSGRKEWVCEVKDYELAVIDMLDDEKVKEAIDACAKRRLRAGIRNQPGVHAYQALSARTY